MHTTRGELEQKMLAALTELTTAQTVAKKSLLEGAETALRKLVDIDDPTSAPRLSKDIVDREAGDMRHTTNKNVGELEQKSRELPGRNSPFAEAIKKLARQSPSATSSASRSSSTASAQTYSPFGLARSTT